MGPRREVAFACLLWLAALSGGSLSRAWPAEDPPPPQVEKVRVTCPGVELDERECVFGTFRAHSLLSGTSLIQLVVVGTPRCAPQGESREPVYEVSVEKVLYGSTTEKTLRFRDPEYPLAPERRIFALMPTAFGESADYELAYDLDVKEENSQRALGEARLDFLTLAADAVMIGKEIAADAHKCTIEVVRLLHGSGLQAGEQKAFAYRERIRDAEKAVRFRREPMLYLLRAETSSSHKTTYRIHTCLPAACEADVVAALRRRDSYPIVNKEMLGRLVRSREVVFRGSVEDAMGFLASERMGVVRLAVDRLRGQPEAARDKVAAAIEVEMFRQAPPAWGEFRKLRNLIRLLGRLGGGAAGGPLARLLEKKLDYLASQPGEPPDCDRLRPPRNRNEADNDSANHALAWLATAMDEQALVKQYGQRMLRLRDTAKGHWRTELQLALDNAHVEDNLELAALAPLARVASPRSAARIFHAGGVQRVAFCSDSQYLATTGSGDGVHIWNTRDWTRARTIAMDGGFCDLAFSADGKFLSVTTEDVLGWLDRRFEWHTGKLVVQTERRERVNADEYNASQELPTPDGKHSVTVRLDYFDGCSVSLQVLETCADRVVAAISSPVEPHSSPAMAISPDGSQVALASHSGRLGFYRLLDLKMIAEVRLATIGRIERLVYSPDNKWLAAVQARRPTPRLFRAATGEEILPYDGHGDVPTDLRFLPDGKTLRSVGRDGTICTWDIATLKMLRRTAVPARRLAASVRPWDGRYALCPLVGDPKAPVQVFDLDTEATVCETTLPALWDQSEDCVRGIETPANAYWLNDKEVMCIGSFSRDMRTSVRRWRFNYHTGQILSEGAIEVEREVPLWYDTGQPTEDGTSVLFVGWFLGKSEERREICRLQLLDATTLKRQPLGDVQFEREPNGPFGLVPGGKYFHLGTHIFDRQSLKLVAARDFPRDELTVVRFSRDGSRYAAVVRQKRGRDDWSVVDDGSSYRRYPSLVRVHETLSGRTLLAFAPSAAVAALAISDDGQRVATANDDGTLEVHDVPAAAAR